jgi:hypothetical protein
MMSDHRWCRAGSQVLAISFDHFLRITIATPSRDQAKPPLKYVLEWRRFSRGFARLGSESGSTSGATSCQVANKLTKGSLSRVSPQHHHNKMWYDVDTGRDKIAKHLMSMSNRQMAFAELKEPALFSSSDGDTSDTPARQGKLFVRVVLHDILWPFPKFLVFILQSWTPSRQMP